MKYTILVWLFTVIVSPLLLAIVLGLIINRSDVNEVLASYEFIFVMIIVGGLLSIPAMIIFWLILRNWNRSKIVLSAYSFISVWITFYFVDSAFIMDWPRQTMWVIIYSLTIVIGIWLFKIPVNKSK